MTLQQIVEKLRIETPDTEKFESIIESMRRRADKGLIPGVTSKDITECLYNLETESARSLEEKDDLIRMISESENVTKSYGYLEEMSDEVFEALVLQEFYSAIQKGLSLNEKNYFDKNDGMSTAGKVALGTAAGGAGLATLGVGGMHLYKNGLRKGVETGIEYATPEAMKYGAYIRKKS